MDHHQLQTLFNSFKQKRIAIIGDVMLDKYIFGSVSRISPEAPVPVIDVASESYRLGGAANVAINIHSLGGQAMLFGAVGNDAGSEQLRTEMHTQGLSSDYLIAEEARPTTVKTRVIAQNHHIVRIDSESRKPISLHAEKDFLTRLELYSNQLDAIIFEDYNKGVLTQSLIAKVFAFAKKNNIPVTVDPKKDNFFEYQHATVFKPNLKEISDALGEKFSNTDSDVIRACELLQSKINSKNIVLTRSEKGMTIYNGKSVHIPTTNLEVADVSGAGDTVIAVLTLGLAAGLDAVMSAKIANIAAGVVCSEVGAVAVDEKKLFEACLTHLSN